MAPKQPRYEPRGLHDLGCNATAGLRETQKRVNNVNELCQRLLSVWRNIGQNVVDKVIDQWCARLTACVQAKGSHFQHLM